MRTIVNYRALMNNTAALYIFFKANRFIKEVEKDGGRKGREREKERVRVSENESEKGKKRKKLIEKIEATETLSRRNKQIITL